MDILDLGCGVKKLPGSVGIDINPATKPDVIHDLNVYPYPFEDSSFDFINVDNVIEHLDNILAVMDELYRIIRQNGTIKIIVPYFRSQFAFIDPTHKHFFTLDSFSYFDPDHPHHKLYPYSSSLFKIEKIVFDEDIKLGVIHSLIKSIANRFQRKYERILGHLIPLHALTFYLKCIK